MKLKNMSLYIISFMALLMPLLLIAGNTTAMYLTDGAKQVSPGVYSNPNDGVCVVGLKFDGTLDVNTGVSNARDCAVYTTSGLKALGQTACTGGAGNDGYKHAWSTGMCVDGSGNPISRVDLDNTAAMCTSRGGTVTGAMCVAYGWQYMNSKPGETIPYRSIIPPSGYKGRTASDNLGFCYSAMRMTSVPYTVVTCPSQNNLSLVCAGGTNSGKTCTVATQGTDCPSSACVANVGWAPGTDGVLYQTQTSYDAGLGWSFAGSQCVYAYGVKGYLNAAITKADGTAFGAAGDYRDLTTITTMGDCLAAGLSWDNWLPYGNGTGTNGNASTVGVSTTPNASSIVKLDATTPVLNGGGQFYSGTGSVCLKCHSDQSRSYIERNKPGYNETGHKLSGDTAPWSSIFGSATPANKWKLKGVQCEVCHATGKPTAQDVGLVIYPNTTGPNAGLPRAASGHNQTEYGSHVTGVCFSCHGTMPSSGNPASVIPVSNGAFAQTTYLLDPIGNQFLNSPHAMFIGANSTVSIITKTNYNSSFVGYLCRSSNSLGVGNILTTIFRNGSADTIPYLDSLSNPACTNPGDGSATSGAAGFVVSEGEAAGTANGVSYVSSDQGNCMTCHDVHWSLGSSNPKAEPMRRECTTCHMNTDLAGSASGAPQLATFKHPGGTGTPLEFFNSDPNNSCAICHMPDSSSNGQLMHLWRINVDSSYSTMGATQANLAADTDFGYTDAAWVDLDHSCGQCHGPSGYAHLFSSSILSPFATDMHGGGAVFPTVCLDCHSVAIGDVPAISGQNHHLIDCLDCHTRGGVIPEPTSTFCLECHSSAVSSDVPAIVTALITHPNNPSIGTPTCHSCHSAGGFIPSVAAACNPCHGGSAGPKMINQVPGVKAPYLTAAKLNSYAAAIHKNVAPQASMTLTANGSKTLSLKDTSTDQNQNLATIKVTWGDNKSDTIAPGATIKHIYSKTGSVTVTLTAIDSKGLKTTVSKKITVI